MVYVLALALIVFPACGGPVLLIPDPPSFEVAAEVVSAVNDVAGEKVLVMSGDAGRVIFVQAACGYYGFNTVYITECSTSKINAVVLVHELGHAFGLPHSNDPESVMYPDYKKLPLEEAARSFVKELSL